MKASDSFLIVAMPQARPPQPSLEMVVEWWESLGHDDVIYHLRVLEGSSQSPSDERQNTRCRMVYSNYQVVRTQVTRLLLANLHPRPSSCHFVNKKNQNNLKSTRLLQLELERDGGVKKHDPYHCHARSGLVAPLKLTGRRWQRANSRLACAATSQPLPQAPRIACAISSIVPCISWISRLSCSSFPWELLRLFRPSSYS